MELNFRKSSHSVDGDDPLDTSCVEVAGGPGFIAVRDSKDPNGRELHLGPADWRRLVAELRNAK